MQAVSGMRQSWLKNIVNLGTALKGPRSAQLVKHKNVKRIRCPTNTGSTAGRSSAGGERPGAAAVLEN